MCVLEQHLGPETERRAIGVFQEGGVSVGVVRGCGLSLCGCGFRYKGSALNRRTELYLKEHEHIQR